MRIEQDAFGKVSLSDKVLYGIQTVRTVENMSFSGKRLSEFPEYIRALAQVKRACALANLSAGVISEEHCNKITTACDQLIQGKHHDQFPVDIFHGGGSIGVNMNVNEVIAHLAGDDVHPFDHVNASQSTADVCHTGLRIALIAMLEPLDQVVKELIATLDKQAESFQSIRTIARTCWQDGMSVPLSSLFEGLSSALKRRRRLLMCSSDDIHSINLGGTVIGSGVGAKKEYQSAIIRELRNVTNRSLKWRENLYDAAQYPDDIAHLSSQVRILGSLLMKFANDLRLLSSGPETGLSELCLPAVQAGSSFFPGKVNPVIAETMMQCSMLIAGNDSVIQSAVEMGEVHLNIWEGMIGALLMQNIKMLTQASKIFHERCVAGIQPNTEQCETYATSFIPVVVELKEKYGYQQVSKWLKEMSHDELRRKIREEK
ncbi:lyase family protein [Aneurinibacillus terranovensis]|uniref:lyase family protein n=1 Tax=Aneurinibacillus terranovensis TaxID=278991 RepID=UPI0003FA47C0|nr:lyase family protein [Aneurinibacillus terranovensis]